MGGQFWSLQVSDVDFVMAGWRGTVASDRRPRQFPLFYLCSNTVFCLLHMNIYYENITNFHRRHYL